ncbi:hypothetical protein A9Q96_09725 [Rhodobacterales bacterium 52_120_T64]|nr:hypothetical protein A9Q96_09725 [Rhodobacterales bacterium 52_120_T64]
MVVVTEAILTLLFPAFAMPPEIDHRITLSQTTFGLAASTGVADDRPTQSATDTKSHIAHTCLHVINTNIDLVLVGLANAPETPLREKYKLSGVEFIFFRPPRIFSQA